MKTIKNLESTIGLNFYQREAGGLNQFPRRPNDVPRDVMINFKKNN